jgi:hypothetical protein
LGGMVDAEAGGELGGHGGWLVGGCGEGVVWVLDEVVGVEG